MIKELIDLQRNAKATCAIIPTAERGQLSPVVIMQANIPDALLFNGKQPPFADRIDAKSKLGEICYFVISGIDEISIEQQNRYVRLVKDREFNGYTLPQNCIIVFTVKDKVALKQISPDLYHFAVVAF